MRASWWIWGLAGLLALGFTLPYTVFSGVERWSGAFLFWVLFGVAVWALLVAAVARWRGDAPDAGRQGGSR